MRFSYLESDTPLAFSHRGAGEGLTENTLAAFDAVAKRGFKYVETDVRTTRDGQLIVFHDRDLARIHGLPYRVESLTYPELSELVEGVEAETRPPLLVDALGEFPELRFNIDLKDAGGVRAVAGVLARTQAHRRVCLTSFSEARVAAVRQELGPGVCTGVGLGAAVRVLTQFLLRSEPLRTAGAVLQFPFRWAGQTLITSSLIQAVHTSGLQVHVWTLNDPESIGDALRLNVDGIMTDAPSLLKQELLTRGMWPSE